MDLIPSYILNTVEYNDCVAYLLDEGIRAVCLQANILRSELDDDMLFDKENDYLYAVAHKNSKNAYVVLLPFEIYGCSIYMIPQIIHECETHQLLCKLYRIRF